MLTTKYILICYVITLHIKKGYKMRIITGAIAAITSFVFFNSIAYATIKTDIKKMQAEILAVQKAYEIRIKALERKLQGIQKNQSNIKKKSKPATIKKVIKNNSFNPSVGVVFNGKASSFSHSGEAEIGGFGVAHEGERGREGLALGETELNFAANVDDKFYGAMTAAIVFEDGSDKVELEEAYFQTLANSGLPNGVRITGGKKFWTMGYLNEHHAHADDFADRPLPNRIYLNKAFNDEGVEVNYVLPTDKLFVEVGGGLFRGRDFPGGNGSGSDSYSAFGRIGGDIGSNQSWRVGAYTLQADVHSRSSNESNVTFSGESDLYVADLRYTWAPTGNPRSSELILQGEYFSRREDGTYNDSEAGTGTIAFDDDSTGFYAQGVYKFNPSWRAGVRYSKMFPAEAPSGLSGSAVDASGHDPMALSFMTDWTNSEFGRIRAQFNKEELSNGQHDSQFILQYIFSIGAHGAHAY